MNTEIVLRESRFTDTGGQIASGIWRFARRKPLGAIGGVLVLCLVVMAIVAPFAAPHDPYQLNLIYKYASPGEPNGDGQAFLLGSDSLGRDILSRIMYGARISLYVGFLSVGVGVTVGALAGIVSGYLGGKIDLVVQRVVDAFMAFPALVFALGILAALGPSLNNVVFTLVLLFIPGSARVVRSQALSVSQTVYVDAARGDRSHRHANHTAARAPELPGAVSGIRDSQPRLGHRHRGFPYVPRSGHADRRSVLGRHVVGGRSQIR